MKIWISIVALTLLTSCATLFERKEYALNICANQENSSVKIYDSIYKLPATIKVKRSKDNLDIVLLTDSVQRNFQLKAVPNRKFVFGNLPFIYLWPLSYGTDLFTDKRFYYGQNIVLDVNDTTMVLKRGFLRKNSHKIYDYLIEKPSEKKGQINLAIGSPIYNSLKNNNAIGDEISSSVGGIKVGFDYYYSDRNFLNLNVTATSPFETGIPLENFGDYSESSSVYLALTQNFLYKRFTFGIGPQYSTNHLKVVTDVPVVSNEDGTYNRTPDIVSNYRSHSLGLIVSTYFRFYKPLYIGVVYRPDFYLLKPESRSNYGHLISVEFIYKIRLKK